MQTDLTTKNSLGVPALARPRRVLLAEDNAELRELLGQMLRHDGFRVLEFGDGTRLLEYLGSMLLRDRASECPDLLITDIRMPGATGLEIVGGLRRAHWSVPVILMSAFDDEATRHAAKRVGGAVLFHKPFDLDDLRTAVLFMLHKH